MDRGPHAEVNTRALVKGARVREAPARRRLLALCIAPALLVVIWPIGPHLLASLTQSLAYVFSDLDVYRIGAHALAHGKDLYGVLPPTRNGVLMPFTYPPFAAVAFIGFTLVSWPVACAGMVVASLAALAAVIYLAASRLWQASSRSTLLVVAAAVPLSLLLDPVGHTLWLGQSNLLLMALVASDCLVERPPWPRGLLVGLAAAIKLTPAAFVLFFVMARDFRAAVATIATFVAAVLAAFAVAPQSSWEYWTGSASGVKSLAGSVYATNQSVSGELGRFHLHGVQPAVWLVLCIAVLALTLLGMRRALREGDPVLALVINAGGGLLVSPVSWAHHWVYVAPALLVMAARGLRIPSKGWAVAAAVTGAIFVLAPYQFLPTNSEQHYQWWQHLVGNPYGLVAVVGLAIIAWPEIKRLRSPRGRTAPAGL